VRRKVRPVLITNAAHSQDEQLHSREVRYLLMMAVRALSLVAVVVLVGAHAPLLWLWVPLCLVGMLVMPWMAVILANVGPRRRGRGPEMRPPTPTEELAAPPAAIDPIRVIDAEQ
jgi:hypothetical protein